MRKIVTVTMTIVLMLSVGCSFVWLCSEVFMYSVRDKVFDWWSVFASIASLITLTMYSLIMMTLTAKIDKEEFELRYKIK